VATKADADKSDTGEPAKAKPKSKKLLLIGGVAVLVLALVGGGAFFLLSKKNAADEEGEEVVHVAPKGPPTYLALDNMVVNLADPGGEKVAQVGITLELADSKSPEKVKPYMPIIRSAVLLLISQRWRRPSPFRLRMTRRQSLRRTLQRLKRKRLRRPRWTTIPCGACFFRVSSSSNMVFPSHL
jgi:flagellar basal body-associated protein FliL